MLFFRKVLFSFLILKFLISVPLCADDNDRVYHIEFRNIPLKQALDYLISEFDIPIIYQKKHMKNITIAIKGHYNTIPELLESLLKKTNLTWQKEGSQYIIVMNSRSIKEKSEHLVLQGTVIDSQTKEPLASATLTITGLSRKTMTQRDGTFRFYDIEPGLYSIQCWSPGYETKQINNIEVAPESNPQLIVELAEQSVMIQEIIVTPSRFSLMDTESTIQQTLTQDDIESMPQFGEDLYRAVNRLPGVSSSNDFSAKFTVRGGEYEEVLVLLDGMELYNPFHLKDINGGALSIIDTVAVESIDLMTGGFPAEYGDRLSGVFNINSKKVNSNYHNASIGWSMMNWRLLSEGSFNDDRSYWFLSGRRGYLDLVLQVMGENPPVLPMYYDLIGKIQHIFNDYHSFSVNYLYSYDHLDYSDEDDLEEAETKYENNYGWLTLNSVFSPHLIANTILSIGTISHQRSGTGYDYDVTSPEYDISDYKSFLFYGLKQNWNFEATDNNLVKWGIDLKLLQANYDCSTIDNRESQSETKNIDKTPSGNKLGAYFSNRYRFTFPLTAECGLRYDKTSYTGDKLLSPRLNMSYSLGKRSYLRTGWGYFYQTQGIHEMNVNDGVDEFYPAQKAEHRVLGFEHLFRNNVHVRLEGYYKKITDLWPDYINLENQIELFPEHNDDRVLVYSDYAISKGIEFYIRKDAGEKISWWMSYALAEVTEHVLRAEAINSGEERLINDDVPGKYDQRHTFYLDFIYRPSPLWHCNVAWQYKTGWPYTEGVVVQQTDDQGNTYYDSTAGELYGCKFPSFHRLDVRFSRTFVTTKGDIKVFLEIMNLYDRGNVYAYEYDLEMNENGSYYMSRKTEYSFHMLPSIGMSWNVKY